MTFESNLECDYSEDLEKAEETIKKLQAELADYHDAEKFVADPPHDYSCCGCVAILRVKIARYEAEMDEWNLTSAAIEKELTFEAENKELQADLIEARMDLVAQNCTIQDGSLDSMAITANAIAMRFLAKHDKIIIEKEYGRRVIGHWVK